MTFKGLRVGDAVVVHHHRGSAEWTVTKVGRKYFTAGSSEFRLEDGCSTSGYSIPRATTLEDHALSVKSDKAEGELRAFGISFECGRSERRERILAVHDAIRHLLPVSADSSSQEKPK